MVLKASIERGKVIRPMAYSRQAGLWEGDAFEVQVGSYRPPIAYPGRPNGPIGIMGKGIYEPNQ